MRRLLDAGVEVFSEQGFHAARVDDIVEVAETSHGTFYLYFSNKEDLLEVLLADVAERLTALTAALEPIGPDDHGRAVLHDWIGQFCALYATHGTIIRTWTEAEVDESAIGQLGTDVLGDLADALGDHLVDLPADADPAIAGLAMLALVERYNYFVNTGQVGLDPDQVTRLLAELTHAALFGPPAETNR